MPPINSAKTIHPVILSGGSGHACGRCRGELSQAVPAAGRRATPCCRRRRCASRRSGAFAPPIVVCQRGAPLPRRRAAARDRRRAAAHPARAGRPQHRAGGRRRRAAGVAEQDPDALLLVLPADHVIARRRRASAPRSTRGERGRGSGALVTFGIVPTQPETGYGYIQAGRAAGRPPALRRSTRFVEKPDARDRAGLSRRRRLLLEQRHVPVPRRRATWPSWSGSTRRCSPRCRAGARRGASATSTSCASTRGLRRRARAISIDYAVMEHTDARGGGAGRRSAGATSARGRRCGTSARKDADGNVDASATSIAEDASNCYLRTDGAAGRRGRPRGPGRGRHRRRGAGRQPRPACRTSRSWSSSSSSDGRRERRLHRRVYRPWGSYDRVDTASASRSSASWSSPARTLSLQMHHHRAEHWVVVSGTAQVTRGDEVFDCCARTSRPTSRSAPSTAWRTPARCRWT